VKSGHSREMKYSLRVGEITEQEVIHAVLTAGAMSTLRRRQSRERELSREAARR